MNKKLNVFLDLLLVSLLSFILFTFCDSLHFGYHEEINITIAFIMLLFIVLVFSWYDKLQIKKLGYYYIITGVFILGLILMYLMDQIENR